jgi:hypothetical protein
MADNDNRRRFGRAFATVANRDSPIGLRKRKTTLNFLSQDEKAHNDYSFRMKTTIWRRSAHRRIGTVAHAGKRLNPFGLVGDQLTSGSSRKGKPRDA